MVRGTKKKGAKQGKKRKPRTQSNIRRSTVKRASALKRLSKKGGRKRAATKKRLAQAGATGTEW